jgi:histidinol-phosphate aminotransferase
MMAQVEELRSLRESTMTQVRGLDLEAKDSQANFFLFGPFANPHDTWEALVDQGILVRDTGVGSYLRTSIGTAEEMDEFMAALSTIAAKERMSS